MTPIKISDKAPLGTDCCGQPIIPMLDKLSMHTNRHPTTPGNAWGWIDGCSLNICWSNDDNRFNSKMASDLVEEYNNRKPTAPTSFPTSEGEKTSAAKCCLCGSEMGRGICCDGASVVCKEMPDNPDQSDPVPPQAQGTPTRPALRDYRGDGSISDYASDMDNYCDRFERELAEANERADRHVRLGTDLSQKLGNTESAHAATFAQLEEAKKYIKSSDELCARAGIGPWKGDYHLGQLTETGKLRADLATLQSQLRSQEAVVAERDRVASQLETLQAEYAKLVLQDNIYISKLEESQYAVEAVETKYALLQTSIADLSHPNIVMLRGELEETRRQVKVQTHIKEAEKRILISEIERNTELRAHLHDVTKLTEQLAALDKDNNRCKNDLNAIEKALNDESSNALCYLAQKAAGLVRQLAAARKDSARINLLEQTMSSVYCSIEGSWQVGRRGMSRSRSFGSIRAAIDGSMSPAVGKEDAK